MLFRIALLTRCVEVWKSVELQFLPTLVCVLVLSQFLMGRLAELDLARLRSSWVSARRPIKNGETNAVKRKVGRN